MDIISAEGGHKKVIVKAGKECFIHNETHGIIRITFPGSDAETASKNTMVVGTQAEIDEYVAANGILMPNTERRRR